jgi:DNA-binding NtrC family response regulator
MGLLLGGVLPKRRQKNSGCPAFCLESQIIRENYIRSYLNERIIAKGASIPQEIPDEGINLEKSLEDMEKVYLLKALKKTGGVKTKAAELLGLDFRALRYKLQKYGL